MAICSLRKSWTGDPAHPCLDSWLMEIDIIDGGCFKLLNCGNLCCSNRRLIQHDFNYHQITHTFISSKTFSCISNCTFYIFSWPSQRYFSFSVLNTRFMFITLKPSSVNSIYHPSSWEANNLGVISDTYFSLSPTDNPSNIPIFFTLWQVLQSGSLSIYFIPLRYASPVLSRVKTKDKIYFSL